MNDLIIRASRHDWGNCVQLFIRDGDRRVEFSLAETMEPGMMYSESAQINNNTAQTLMDDLWSSGFRPTEGSGSAGSLRATEKHLADMRKIAGKSLEIEL